MVVGKKSFAEWARTSEAPDPSSQSVAASVPVAAPSPKRSARRRAALRSPPPRQGRGWLWPLLLGIWLGTTLGDD